MSSKSPPDDARAERMSPKRGYDQLNAAAARINAEALKLRKWGSYLPPTTIDAPYSKLRLLAEYLADLAAAVLVGEVPIVDYRDDGPAPDDRPILDALERVAGGECRVAGQDGPDPIPDPATNHTPPATRKKPKRPPPTPDPKPAGRLAARREVECDGDNPVDLAFGRLWANRDDTQAAPAEPEIAVMTPPVSLAAAKATFAADDAESWRDELVEALDLADGIAAKLAGAGLATVGALADLLNDEDGDYRDLDGGPVGLDFEQARKVRAALDLWWRAGGGDWPARWTLGDTPGETKIFAALADWLQRRRVGDDAPKWGRYSEFAVKLCDGQSVAVVYDPSQEGPSGAYSGPGTGPITYHGPVSSTGFWSDASRPAGVAVAVDIVTHCETFARDRADQWARDRAKHERAVARKAKPKPKRARDPILAAYQADDLSAQIAVEWASNGEPDPEGSGVAGDEWRVAGEDDDDARVPDLPTPPATRHPPPGAS